MASLGSLLYTSGSPSCASTLGSPSCASTLGSPSSHTSVHMPEATLPAAPITQGAPPVRPATSAPPPSSEPTVTVSLAEFRGLVHSLQTLSTAQDSLI
ncbi:hypothetical protein CK203_057032 [Vitis vinifera]|uniref:Uncharacterized protein n=1 Tax=Vitis vinifera TaxID=29760 RepID=A0A438GN69_VITVI|nr:hypothetical protein CK203_057032 [Vitis vinifera]